MANLRDAVAPQPVLTLPSLVWEFLKMDPAVRPAGSDSATGNLKGRLLERNSVYRTDLKAQKKRKTMVDEAGREIQP